jgi:hypothetical protein
MTAFLRYESAVWVQDAKPAAADPRFSFVISRFLIFQGVLFLSVRCRHEDLPISALFVTFGTDVLLKSADGTHELECNEYFQVPPRATSDIRLGFQLVNGIKLIIDSPGTGEIQADAGSAIFSRFLNALNSLAVSDRVLEIGARVQTGIDNKGFVPKHLRYTGFDIKAGQNVDVTGDAHALSQYFESDSFAMVFSIAVFEHLLMPWKVAVEMNRVMKTGGMGYIMSHQTFPLHEEPWDFWRFSDTAWQSIFNKFTGFEIIEAGFSGRAHVAAEDLSLVTYKMDEVPAYLLSHVLFIKIGPSSVDWPVDVAELLQTSYPH